MMALDTRSEILAKPLARLPEISLERLNACGELLDRVDRKYLLEPEELSDALAWLPAGSFALEIDGQRQFGYRSEYFDTPTLASFRAAALKRRRRYKVRIRSYDSGLSWLEVKLRSGRGRTQKLRIEQDSFEPTWVGEVLASAGFPASQAWELYPTLEVAFTRSTLLIPTGTNPADSAGQFARVTIDTDLAWREPDGYWQESAVTVLETKSPGHFTAFDKALWRSGIRPARFSKYATGLASLHPELPANKWRRALNRHF
ncbi:MAG: VTC domain-containing protein [Propionibacteriaceae bacterium]|jgi:hypothetical protein|nr:VTC domain-containing protein [Propionibacteriaceae bacterium]